jgi:hypothetical protein
VPCSKSIDGTRFPYSANKPEDRYRLVLGVVSVPPAYRGQIVRTGAEPRPLTFRVGHRSATVRFGLGRRCG